MGAILVCPSCESEHGDDARFCSQCGMPLVRAGGGEARVNERQERARKIKPQYAQGALVRAVWARNQAEAELIEGMLLEEGIPSVMRRPQGFDVPDFMAAGPRELLVARSGLEAAREVLLQNDIAPRGLAPSSTPRATRLLAALLLGLALLTVVLFMAIHVWD
ncbi:MAG TPA: zinc-ribbon domain-containing protein [Solirubrobacteraceae bacterium]|nr:zinc-ribbon domain-containing protein [Solirubrobacteraceae bacterium]